jgi:hypothetical protein
MVFLNHFSGGEEGFFHVRDSPGGGTVYFSGLNFKLSADLKIFIRFLKAPLEKMSDSPKVSGQTDVLVFFLAFLKEFIENDNCLGIKVFVDAGKTQNIPGFQGIAWQPAEGGKNYFKIILYPILAGAMP